MAKAAVVIGVDKTGDLPLLRDAAAGAQRVAEWLQGEGYAVDLLTDGAGPVKSTTLYDTIKGICDAGTCEKLLIYFSGHGYLIDYTEHWLLSEAPLNGNESVSLEANIALARDCGIPNVIFVSDACRSTPQSLRADRMRGCLVFPNFPPTQQQPAKIDRFYACLAGNSAVELPVERSTALFRALYTTCLQDAFVDTDASHCRQMDGAEVLTNYTLGEILPAALDKAAFKAGSSLSQRPDARIESGETIYIARVVRTQGGPPAGDTRVGQADEPKPDTGTSIEGPFKTRDAMFAFPERKLDVSDLGLLNAGEEGALAFEILYQGKALSEPDEGLRPVPSLQAASGDKVSRGIAITGTTVTEARGLGCQALVLLSGDEGENALIQVTQPSQGADTAFQGTVLIRFADGGGAALVAPPGYVGHVHVNAAGANGACVEAVSYMRPNQGTASIPASTPSLRTVGGVDLTQRLTASAGRLADQGLFRVTREQSVALAALASDIGVGEDPALALLAAYALNDIGRSDLVVDIATSCARALGGSIFYDFVLLARRNARLDTRMITPFCPLLSKGWQLLHVMGGEMAPLFQEAGSHRRAALWTTFDATGMDILMGARQ